MKSFRLGAIQRLFSQSLRVGFAASLSVIGLSSAEATTFTTTVPGTSITLPDEYPEAGGVAIVMVGQNGNVYYQFSDPANAFVGFNNRPNRAVLGGNPFTINDPIALNCGFSSCRDYFGGGLQRVYIRFSAYDGDTQNGGFDQNDITLRVNGIDVGNWSGRTTERTNTNGTQSLGFGTGFGNNTFDTGWFDSSNQTLLESLLNTGETLTQVFDRDPNDNYWNFQRGPSLGNTAIATVAPGYNIEKTATPTTYAAVNDTITYNFALSNVGSVAISSLEVVDDQITARGGTVTCDKTTIQARPFNDPAGPDTANCSATYQITQEDIDNRSVVNIASATGEPDEGVLGAVTDTATVTGTPGTPNIEIRKTTTLSNFGNAGTTVPYSFEIENTGTETLTNIDVTDARIPGLSCPTGPLAPAETLTCSGNYTVTQTDVDSFINGGVQLENTANVTAQAPFNGSASDSDTDNLPGPAAAPDFTISKITSTPQFDTDGEILRYTISIANTGNVTFPAVPAVTDSLGITVSCPAGVHAPGQTRICTAEYPVDQDDLNAGVVDNTATADITIDGVNVNKSSSAQSTAVQTSGIELTKRLRAGGLTSYDTIGQSIDYDYVVRNTGNVTLSTVRVDDDRVTVTCPAAEILPNTEIVCLASETVEQGDLNDGSITNNATAFGTPPSAAEISDGPKTVTVNAQQTREISLAKVAGSTVPAYQVGGTIEYTYTVENTGNVDLNGPFSIDDDKIGVFECFAGNLLVGTANAQVCTETYTILPADIGTGFVQNLATASGDGVTSPQAQARVDNTATPEISVEKVADVSPIPAGTTVVDYTFTVRNTGAAQIVLTGDPATSSPITVNDPKIGTVDCGTNQPATFSNGDSFTCTGSYTLDQTEIDAGEVVNTASASFPFSTPSGRETLVSPSVTVTTPIDEDLDYTFAKSGPATFSAVGDILTYTFTVENTGNVTLTNVVVDDPLIPLLNCPITNLAPGLTDSCTGTYEVLQADVNTGSIPNTANAVGQSQSGAQLPKTDNSTATRTPTANDRTFAVNKVAQQTDFSAVGETLSYTIEVENTGLQTITNVMVTDDLDANFSCTISSIAPGQTDSTCRFFYETTQDDVDTGSVTNTARASNADFGPVASTRVVNGPTRLATFETTKTALGSYTAAGNAVDFRVTLENTGNVRITNAQVVDRGVTCTTPGTLEPGEIDNSCVFPYVVTQTDVDRGFVDNIANATGTGADGTALSDNPAARAQGPAENASVNVTKTATDGTYASATDTERFTFEVFNTGNVTLTGLVLTDVDSEGVTTFTCPVADLLPGASTVVCDGGASMEFTKAFDQGDVDAGSYTNEATIVGQSAINATAVTASQEVTVSGPQQTPAVSVVKATSFTGNIDTVGQVIPYTYTVTNAGNITITGDISVTDSVTTLTPAANVPVTCPAVPAGTPTVPGGLAVGASLVCNATYTVTQADIDANSVDNLATASVTQSVVPQNVGDPSVVTATAPSNVVSVPVAQTFALSLDKRLTTASARSFSAVNDALEYEYFVTNTGNTTITSEIKINDDRFPAADLSCSVATIAPGGTALCAQTYAVIQGDLNDGEVTNVATAFIGPDLATATTQSNSDTVTVAGIQNPVLFIDKTIVLDGTESFVDTQPLSYSYLVRNDGNVSITIDPATTVTDDRTTVTCAGAPTLLPPLGEFTCTSTGVVTQNDISLGSTTNTAFAEGEFDGAPVVSPTDLQVFPVNAAPAIAITKTVDPSTPSFTAVGDVLIYNYEIRNTGNVDLIEALVIEDDQIPGQLACPDPTGGTFKRISDDSAEIAVCSQPYTVDQDDIDRGFVVNMAFGKTTFGTSPILPVQSPSVTENVAGTVNAELALLKEVSPTGPFAVGDTLTYTLTASVAGNQTVAGVSIADPLLPTLVCRQSGNIVATADLDPSIDPLICTGTYVATQTDVDKQQIVNTASASGAAPDGSTVRKETMNTLGADVPRNELLVTKRVTPAATSAGDPNYSAVGQTVTFQIEVENRGNVTVDAINVADTAASVNAALPASCLVGTLAPGGISTVCEFTVEVTQTDIDNGSFLNTATATGTPRSGGSVTGSGDVVAQGPPSEPSFSMSKAADVSSFDAVGDIITYTFIIGNTGNVTLFAAPVLVDDKIGTVNCPALPTTGIPPLETITCTATYAVTQDEVDAGFVTNMASVTSTEVTTPATATETVDAVRTPGVSMTKTPSITADAKLDDVIEYTYRVENTGNVSLFNVTVDDTQTSAAGSTVLTIAGDTLATDAGETGDSPDGAVSGIWGTLSPGDVVEFTASYTVTQADIDAGLDLSNTANVATQTLPGTTPPSDTKTVVVPVEDAAPELTAEKRVTGSTGSAAGDTVSFEFTVQNTGNVTLTIPAITDTLRRTDGTPISLTTGPSAPVGDTVDPGRLNLGEILTYQATYILTQEDIDAGGVSNSVLAESTGPNGEPAMDTSGNGLPGGADSPTVFAVPAAPSIVSEKRITSTTVAVDERVTFEIKALNDGNVTLTSVAIADALTRNGGEVLSLSTGPSFANSDKGSPAGILLPGETATYLATYVLIQEDIDAGGIANSATATGTPPLGAPVSDVSDNDGGAGENDPTVLVVPAAPALAIDKRLAAGEPGNFDTLGQVINFEFEIENTGNVTLPGPFTVSDALIEGSNNDLSCPAGPLAPEGTLVCTGSYEVIQGDLDLGSVTNSATVSDGTSTSPADVVVVPAIQRPALETVKTAPSIAPEDFDVGLEVTYTYVVTNTGNTTVTMPISVSDNLIDTVTCGDLPAGGLLPTTSISCTGTYTVSATDVDLREVTNLASATDGVVTSLQTSETIPDDAVPSLAITKVATIATFAEVGDIVNYTYSVTNNGTQAFAAAVNVFDTKITPGGALVCYTPSGANPSLSVGETIECSFPYSVIQDDLDAGQVTNEAYAQTTFGTDDTPVTSPPTTETVDAVQAPNMSLSKTSSPNPAGPVGSFVTYTLVAENTGTVTLNTVVVSDPKLPELVCEQATLLRGETLTCTGSYEVLQGDIDSPEIVNTASVTAMTPQGEMLPNPVTATETTDVPTQAPAISVVKTASPTTLGPVGSFVTYNFAVTNGGITTLSAVQVSDVLDPNAPCVIASIAPNITDNFSCSYSLEVTQEMVDAGGVTNRVDVSGTDPFGASATGFDEIFTDGPTRTSGLDVTKLVAANQGTVVGADVEYRLVVENTGNVTLDVTGITDTMTRLRDGSPTALDAPFALLSGDTNDDGRLDVGETFVYAATHELTQEDVNQGGLVNTASVTADAPTGVPPASDVSDNGNDGDGNTDDDSTLLEITAEPQLRVTKVLGAEQGTTADEFVEFTITATNIGNVDIENVVATDNLTRANNVVLTPPPLTQISGGSTLVAGQSASWTLRYQLTQDDIDAGGLLNSATVSGQAPNGDAVTDVSDNNNPTDGNIENDQTAFVVTPAPSLAVVKTARTVGTAAGEQVIFDVVAENTGNVTLSGVSVTGEDLRRLDGTVLTPDEVRFVSADMDSVEGALKVGETATFEVIYTLLLEDVDAGGVTNSATVSGTSPGGAVIFDVSDDGAGNDRTPAPIAAMPSNTLLKTASEPRVLLPMVYAVTFTLSVENTGNVTQSAYQLIDDLSSFEGTATILRDTPFSLNTRVSGFADAGVNEAYDGAATTTLLTGNPTLAPGEIGLVEIDVNYTTEFGGATGSNTFSTNSGSLPADQQSTDVSVAVVDTDGDGVPDNLEGNGDRDGDGTPDDEDYDPTGYFYCEDDGRLIAGATISVTGPFGTQTGVGSSNFINIVKDGTDSEFQFFATRAGTYTMAITYPAGATPSTTRLAAGTLDATTLLPANPASIGSSEFGNTNRLADFSAGANTFYTSFTLELGDPFIINNNIPLTNCQGTPDILATKQADRTSAVFGETVNFTLGFTNNTSNAVNNMSLVDLLPAGMLYTPNSAAVDGVPLEPTVAGLRLTWPGLNIAPAQTINVTLSARVVANGSYGELTNRAFMTDAAGTTLSNVATATVRIEPEHVFDCSDIIGKVFDDKNQNGYQDQGEPGLPGVRLATVRGVLITTDDYGRYHVPCAELPKEIGSNFTLKLDTRTLPTGYRVTTENPRVIRVTAGKFAKLNFGASLSNVVDVDLTAAAFVAGTATPSEALERGVEGLLQQIKSTPSVLRISYILQGEDRKTANARLKAVENLIRQKWRGGGRYKLNIERSIKRAR